MLFVLLQDKKPDWALQKDGRSKSMASVNDAPRSSESETVKIDNNKYSELLVVKRAFKFDFMSTY